MNTGIFSGGRITCYIPFRKQCDSTFEKKEKGSVEGYAGTYPNSEWVNDRCKLHEEGTTERGEELARQTGEEGRAEGRENFREKEW